MCGIIGVFNHEQAEQQVKTALAILKNRGKDGSSTYGKGKNYLGHTLHAIINHVSQPLKGDGVLTANCEIYNWEELNQKYSLSAKNDADLLLKFLDKFSLDKIDELDGVYAFAYWKNDVLCLVRDLLGVKPIWYSYNLDRFAFASEKKALEKIGYLDIQELNPRQMIKYNLTNNGLNLSQREFFNFLPEHQDDYEVIKDNVERLLDASIKKRIPQKKFGLLFSGGIDSTYLAKYFQDNGHEFTCYTAVLETEGTENKTPSDLVYAQKIAEQYGFKLKIRKIRLDEIPEYLKKIIPLIEDSNVVKVGVALTFYFACELAKKDGCKVIFSGLGSEEIFAGYERHKNSSNINQECLSGLRKMYERDLYRDDVLTMDNNLELRLPFLDKGLVSYCLKIPGKYKIREEISKFILREISLGKNIDHEFSFRKKTAAQYGSKLDYALSRLSKQNNFSSRSAYLRTFYPEHNLRLGVLFSSGKDSTYSAYIMQRQNYQLSCLITIKSKNPDSYMFHTPAVELAGLQAEAMELPILIQETAGEKESELADLELALKTAKEKYHLDGIITGAVFSTYQRDRIEKICDQLGLKIFSPLWHKPQDKLMEELLQNKFEFIFTGIAAEGLDISWLNKIITLEDLDKLKSMTKRFGNNLAGEGGEFESLVVSCPLFKKRLVIEEAEIQEENKITARLLIRKVKLV